MAFFEFGTRPEALLYEEIERGVGFDKSQRQKFGSVRAKFDAGVEMQDFCQTGRSEALFFESLAQGDLIALGLDLHAEFIALEGEAGGNGIMQLSLILLGNIQRFVDNMGEVPSVCQIVVAQSGREGEVLSLRIQGEIGRVHLLFRGEALVNGVAQIELGGEGPAEIVGLFVSIENGSGNVLNVIAVPSICSAPGARR